MDIKMHELPIRRPGTVLLGLIATLLWNGVAAAQGLTGALIGTVKDDQDGVLASAVVRLDSPSLIGGLVTLTTNERGQLRFPSLPPGVYELDMTMAGFATLHEADILIGAGATMAMGSVEVPRTAKVIAASMQYFSGKPRAANALVPLPQTNNQATQRVQLDHGARVGCHRRRFWTCGYRRRSPSADRDGSSCSWTCSTCSTTQRKKGSFQKTCSVRISVCPTHSWIPAERWSASG